MTRAAVLLGTVLIGSVLLVGGTAESAAAQEPVEERPGAQEQVRVAELIADPTAYVDTVIAIEGELVGDYGFRRDGYMWTQLNDDSYARDALVDGGPRTGPNIGVGIRMPSELARDLDPVGGYRLEGPVVRVTGTWRYHDPNRGGESYFEVVALEIVEPGRRLDEGPDWIVFASGVALVIASLVMWLTHRRETDE